MLWFLPCLDTSYFQSSQLVAVSIWIWSISKTLSFMKVCRVSYYFNNFWTMCGSVPAAISSALTFLSFPASLFLTPSLPPRRLQRHELVLLKVTHSPFLARWTRLLWESQKYAICQATGFTASILCSSPARASFRKYYKNKKIKFKKQHMNTPACAGRLAEPAIWDWELSL